MTAIELRAQDKKAIFRAASELVLVDVQVRNKKTGAPAPLLHAGDFEVWEEGVRQEIVAFSRDEFRISVVLLFDLTDSVRGVLQRLADSSKAALEHFKAADEVAVMVYAGHATLVDGFTKDRARTVRAIESSAKMKSGQPAYFNEAIFQAAMQLRGAGSPANRRVIIWLTDNLPNVPDSKRFAVHTEAEALRALYEEGVVVAPILLKNPLWATAYAVGYSFEAWQAKAYPPGDAKKYAELTGGQVVGLGGARPDERLAQLIDELRARYTIGYRPSDSEAAGTFRKIQVALTASGTLRPKEWRVLHREGYYRK